MTDTRGDLVARLRDCAESVEGPAEHASEPLSYYALALVDCARDAANEIERWKASNAASEPAEKTSTGVGSAAKMLWDAVHNGGATWGDFVHAFAITAPSTPLGADGLTGHERELGEAWKTGYMNGLANASPASTPPEDGMVEVTQADRDAAAGYFESLDRPGATYAASIVRRGERDDLLEVQAFARHRQKALLAPADSKCIMACLNESPHDCRQLEAVAEFRRLTAPAPAPIEARGILMVEEPARRAYEQGFDDGFVSAHVDETGFPDEAATLSKVDHVARHEGWAANRDALLAPAPTSLHDMQISHAPIEARETELVEGPTWADQNGVWTAEIQIIGGHEVFAHVYGQSEEGAVANRTELLTRALQGSAEVGKALRAILGCDDDARAAKGIPRATLNGYGLTDMFDLPGEPDDAAKFPVQPSRSCSLEVALTDARAAVAALPQADRPDQGEDG